MTQQFPSINLEYVFSSISGFFRELPSFYQGAASAINSWRLFFVLFDIILVVLVFVILVKTRTLQQTQARRNLLSLKKESPLMRKNERWEAVKQHLGSENPPEWKLAVIEADIMLDELVRAMGYEGETLGDRLKAIEPSDFLTLREAWEAHKVRNKVAHEGVSFFLTRREAARVISLYEKVFQEFSYI